ncbi:hypothetical protein ACHAWF_017294 [Thalassiosira exigua]
MMPPVMTCRLLTCVFIFIQFLVSDVVDAKVYNIEDFGAKPGKDSSDAIRSALAAAAKEPNGAEVLVPRNEKGEYLTSPINITSNIVFRVDGNLTGLRDQEKYPIVDNLPSYDEDLDDAGGQLARGHRRRHPLIWSVNATNVTICGNGTIDGSGSYWLEEYHNRTLLHAGRPHLMEIMGGKDITITGPGLTLLNSAFWTLHPVYSNNLHIHHINIVASNCKTWTDKCNPNIDGIDVDSSTNVLIEYNYISVGDDHVTVLAGRGNNGRLFGRPSRNVTVRNNVLGTGMGLSIGSSVSGGVEDVLYYNNVMAETRQQWGQGIHVKTRVGIGGYIKNVVWDGNNFLSTGKEAILIEGDYQSKGSCDESNCTRIEGLLLKNLVFHNSSSPGRIVCSDKQPCSNITMDNVTINGFVSSEWGNCKNVISSTFTNVLPTGLEELCAHEKSDGKPTNDKSNGKKRDTILVVFICIFAAVPLIGLLCYFKYRIRTGWKRHHQDGTDDVDQPLLGQDIS